jgi:hypothetical protein
MMFARHVEEPSTASRADMNCGLYVECPIRRMPNS